jgi:hypothetical protein
MKKYIFVLLKKKISSLCFDSITNTIKEKKLTFELKSNFIEFINDYIFNRKYNVSHKVYLNIFNKKKKVIDCFLYFDLQTIIEDKYLPERFIKKNDKKSKKKEHKELTFEVFFILIIILKKEEIERDFQLSSGIKETEENIKINQTNILRNIILCYVRLLKGLFNE